MVPKARLYLADVGPLWRHRLAPPHSHPLLHGQRPSIGPQEHHRRHRCDRILLPADALHRIRCDGQRFVGPERHEHGSPAARQKLFRAALCSRLGHRLYHRARDRQRSDRRGRWLCGSRLRRRNAGDETQRSAIDPRGQDRFDRHRSLGHPGRIGLRRHERHLPGRMGLCDRRVGKPPGSADAPVLQRDDQARDHLGCARRHDQLSPLDRLVPGDVQESLWIGSQTCLGAI